MLNYAQIWWESCYAQNYPGIMCQGLMIIGACLKAGGWLQPGHIHVYVVIIFDLHPRKRKIDVYVAKISFSLGASYRFIRRYRKIICYISYISVDENSGRDCKLTIIP
jgi:hypothetical protein